MKAPKRFRKIYIEISNVCNLACDFCPEPDRDKNFMGPELFERIIADAAPLTEQVCFHLWGEPLAHPRFAEYVAFCGERGVAVNIATNGTLLTPERVEALLHPAVAQVNFSIHSFESNFKGKDIGPYLEKIFEFTRLAFERRPDLYVNYRLWNLEGTDAGRNEDVASRVEKAFGVELGRAVDVRWRKSRRVTHRLYLNFDSRFDWPSPKDPILSDRGTCHALSGQLGILSDGTVVPCCLDKEGKIPLGDAKRQTLAEVLASERAAAMARGFKEGRLAEDLCRRCTFITRFDRKAIDIMGRVRVSPPV